MLAMCLYSNNRSYTKVALLAISYKKAYQKIAMKYWILGFLGYPFSTNYNNSSMFPRSKNGEPNVSSLRALAMAHTRTGVGFASSCQSFYIKRYPKPNEYPNDPCHVDLHLDDFDRL